MTFFTHTGSKSCCFGLIGRSLAVAALFIPAAAGAQLQRDTRVDRSGLRTVEVWAGFSPYSPRLGVLGNRPGLSFAIAAARITRRVKTRHDYAIDYTADFIPLAMVSPPLRLGPGGDGPYDVPRPSCDFTQVRCHFPDGSAQGWGVAPLGVSALLRRDRFAQFRLGANGGVMYFNRAVPTEISTRFNFTAAVEAGVQLVHHDGFGLLLAYRFHHISNAGTGYDNSAIASNVISLGARWRRDRD